MNSLSASYTLSEFITFSKKNTDEEVLGLYETCNIIEIIYHLQFLTKS